MQASSAGIWPRLKQLLFGSKTSHGSHDAGQSSRPTAAAASHETPNPETSTLCNTPSHLVANSLDRLNEKPNTDAIPSPPSSLQVSSLGSSARCTTLVSGMDSIPKTIEEEPEGNLPTSSTRADESERHHSPALQATRPSADKINDALDRSKENDQDDTPAVMLQKHALDRTAVMDLRSDAQEQSRALRRQYQEFIQDSLSLVVEFKANKPDPASAESDPLSDRVDALATFAASIEEARKVFHRSQERLQKVEFRLMEGEKRIYGEHVRGQAPSVVIDDLATSFSSLSSVRPSSSVDENGAAPNSSDHDVELAPDDVPDLDPSGQRAQSDPGLPHANTLPINSTVPHAQSNTPVHSLHGSRALGDTPKPDLDDTGDHSPRHRTATEKSSDLPTVPGHRSKRSAPPSVKDEPIEHHIKEDPMELSFVGSGFTDILKDMPLTTRDDIGRAKSLPEPSVSDYAPSEIWRWLAYGVPWNLIAENDRQRPASLPGGISTLRAMTIGGHEATALGFAMSGQLDLMREQSGHKVRAAHDLLMRNWLWDPAVRPEPNPTNLPAANPAERHTHNAEAGGSTERIQEEVFPTLEIETDPEAPLDTQLPEPATMVLNNVGVDNVRKVLP